MKFVHNTLALVSGIPIVIIAAITIADILYRMFTGQAIAATYEITSTLMPFVVFLALPLITFENSHISVNVLDGVLPQKHTWLLDLIRTVLGATLLWIISAAAWKLGVRAVDWNTTTALLRIPLGYLILFIACSLKLTSVIYIYQTIETLVKRFKRGKI